MGINLSSLKLWNNNKNISQLPRIYDDDVDTEIKKTKAVRRTTRTATTRRTSGTTSGGSGGGGY